MNGDGKKFLPCGDEDRVFITRVPNPIQDTSVPPRLHVNPTAISREIHAPRIGVAEVGVPYVEPVEVVPPPMRHARPIETILNTYRYVPTTSAPPPPDLSVAPAPWVSEFPDARVHIARVPNAVEDTSVAPKLPVNSAFMVREIGAPRVGVAEVGVPYVEPVDVAPPPMVRPPVVETIIGTSRRVRFEEPSLMSAVGETEVTMNGVFPCITYGGQNPIYAPFASIAGLSGEIININSNIATLSTELTNLSAYVYTIQTDPSQWALFPAVSTINASGNAITNISSLQLDDQVLTALSGELLLNGVPIATIPDISNVEDWAYYPALSNIDANNFAIQNVSGLELDGQAISALGNTILVNGINPVSNWAAYQANASLDMAGFSISNTPSISISGTTQNVVLTALATALLVDGQPVYTGALPPSTTPDWALYPSVTNVNVSGFNVQNVSGLNALNVVTPTITMCSSVTTTSSVTLTANDTQLLVDGQPVYTGALPPSDTSNWSLYNAKANVNMSGFAIISPTTDLSLICGSNIVLNCTSNVKVLRPMETKGIDMTGVLTQCNAGGGSNFFQSEVQVGVNGVLPTDNLGVVAIYGGNVPVGLSTFYVKGGCTLDGNLTKGHTIGCLPAAGINTQRIDVLPVGINITTPTFITMNGLGAMNAALGGAIALAAGSYITLEHGAGLGQNGIFVQDTARDSNAKMIFTGGGTLYNATEVQASNIVNPLGVRFYNGVYNPSGGSIIVPPVYGRAIVDLSTSSSYFATLTGGDLPATKNSNSVFVGNFPSLTTGGVASTIAIGDISGMTGQGAYSVAIGADAGQSNHGTWAIAVGSNAGRFNQGNGAVAIGLQCGLSGQGVNATAIGNVAGYSNQAQYAVAVGLESGQYSQGQNAVSIGWQAGQSNQRSNAVAVGYGAGNSNQSSNAVAVGTSAGCSNQASNAVAIGYNAGFNNQLGDAVAIGVTAGYSNQSLRAVAIGAGAGSQSQSVDSVAIGTSAGGLNHGINAVAIGLNAGQSNQGLSAVSVGQNAGQSNQGSNSVAIGFSAGSNVQGIESVAIGLVAGFNQQGTDAVAVGAHSGEFNQANFCTAVGYYAGHTGQGYASTGLGVGAGFSGQGSNSVAVGFETGNANLGSNSVAIGCRASSNGGSFSNTIVVNATGSALNPAQANSTYIAPIRETPNSNAYQTTAMVWNSVTKEVNYDVNLFSLQVLAVSATPIVLTPNYRGKIFILTGGGTQALTTSGLTANDTNFFCIIRNGAGTGGGLDVTLTGVTGATTIHNQTGATNAGQVYCTWTGTALVAY